MCPSSNKLKSRPYHHSQDLIIKTLKKAINLTCLPSMDMGSSTNRALPVELNLFSTSQLLNQYPFLLLTEEALVSKVKLYPLVVQTRTTWAW
jgi:hypothetical protein